ncbi:MAG: HEAT repeat domain-containing protein [Planctomycetes bacterium]|nr:HEAT repeat domain-containing protein [Planctomycetota bacterium]
MRTMRLGLIALLLHGPIPAGEVPVDAGTSVEALIAQARDSNDQTRLKAVAALRARGRPAKPATAVLIERLKDKGAHVKHCGGFSIISLIAIDLPTGGGEEYSIASVAADALIKIGADAKLAAPALADLLADDDDYIRTAAHNALMELQTVPEAVPAIVRVLQSDSKRGRVQAASLLKSFGKNALTAREALTDALLDPEKDVRSAAAEALPSVGPLTGTALPRLIANLKDRDFLWGTCHAAQALARFSNAEMAVPSLTPILHAKNKDLRSATFDALCEMGPKARMGMPDLIAALADGDEDVRSKAVQALGNLGPDASDAIPRLCELFKDRRNLVRIAVAGNLRKITSDHSVLLETYRSGLKDKVRGVRVESAKIMGELGPEAREAIPDLLKALDKNDYPEEAAEALGNMGPDSAAAVPLLIRELKQGYLSVRRKAAVALGQIGRAQKDCVPALIEALGDTDTFLQENAAQALAAFGVQAKAALPALESLGAVKNERVKKAAADALKAIRE